MKLLGFFLFIFGWFGLENYGFDFQSFLMLIVGAFLIGGLDMLLTFKRGRERNGK